jgi:hypothetical protein
MQKRLRVSNSLCEICSHEMGISHRRACIDSLFHLEILERQGLESFNKGIERLYQV